MSSAALSSVEKRGVLLPPLACPPKCAEDERGGCGQPQSARRKPPSWGHCEVPAEALPQPCRSLCHTRTGGDDAEHKGRLPGPAGPAPPALGARCCRTWPEEQGWDPTLHPLPGSAAESGSDGPKRDIGSKAGHGPEIQTRELRWGALPLGELWGMDRGVPDL